jgi:glycosyltransferase involved in cell wall biosynthesis
VNVSAVIPVFLSERYLAEAIESVHAQTTPVLEIVVVDDGSPDGSAALAARLGARCVRQQNAGIGAARNRGVKEARGAAVAFLDADDRWARDRIERQVGLLEGDPALSGVLGEVQQFVSPELSEAERARLECPPEPQAGGVPGALLVRRDDFLATGGFDERLRVGEFVDWYARARETGLRIAFHEGVVLHRRLHASNTMRARRDEHATYARILKDTLDRRRSLST